METLSNYETYQKNISDLHADYVTEMMTTFEPPVSNESTVKTNGDWTRDLHTYFENHGAEQWKSTGDWRVWTEQIKVAIQECQIPTSWAQSGKLVAKGKSELNKFIRNKRNAKVSFCVIVY